MHSLHSLKSALLFTILASISSAQPISTTVLPRFTLEPELPLLLAEGMCRGFELTNGNMFTALCIGMGDTVGSTVNLDKCIVNNDGELSFLSQGNFSETCSGCMLDDSLNLTCNCMTAFNEGIMSTINIDGTMAQDGGVIVMDNGQLICTTAH